MNSITWVDATKHPRPCQRALCTANSPCNDHFDAAKPERAHEVLAAWEARGWPAPDAPGGRSLFKAVITQNIDSVSPN